MKTVSSVLDNIQSNVFHYLILKVLLAVWWADWLLQSHFLSGEGGRHVSVSKAKPHLTITTAPCWAPPVYNLGCFLCILYSFNTLTQFQSEKRRQRVKKTLTGFLYKPGVVYIKFTWIFSLVQDKTSVYVVKLPHTTCDLLTTHVLLSTGNFTIKMSPVSAIISIRYKLWKKKCYKLNCVWFTKIVHSASKPAHNLLK